MLVNDVFELLLVFFFFGLASSDFFFILPPLLGCSCWPVYSLNSSWRALGSCCSVSFRSLAVTCTQTCRSCLTRFAMEGTILREEVPTLFRKLLQ